MSLPARYLELRTRLAEIHDLDKVSSLLSWDQAVTMPPGGAPARAEQMATVGRLAHDLFTSANIGQLLDQLAPFEASLPYESDEASLIRATRWDYEKARRIPGDLRSEMTRVASLARTAWATARAQSDFAAFKPFLQQTLDLKRRYVDCFEPRDEPYDVLLDDFERGMPSAEVRQIFVQLKEAIVPLIARVSERSEVVDDSCLRGHFAIDRQREVCLAILRRFGYTDREWRFDPTAHPFASNTSLGDIRLTTRYYDNYLAPSLFGSMHECGHGLYEHGISPALERTPLCRGTSLGIHESQSRLWENLVGRSREAWRCFLPELQAAFPDQLAGVDLETFYRAINKVQPGLIRVEADELTYGLHVVLRFELEQDMLSGALSLDELPEAWNARMKSYLGVDVPDAASGVLQDVHWSLGYIGYFPTYVIGSIVSAQIWEKALDAMPDLRSQFERGEFLVLREWLRENLHRHGRKFTPKETLKKVTGADTVDVRPYVNYLTGKFTEIYGLS
ncbi:MAG TPA: carboxypeptidase M32 [Vicinamibacterales bacterium]|nr:carboxypeptidase M32 [Vicinamibacterales bacterium]